VSASLDISDAKQIDSKVFAFLDDSGGTITYMVRLEIMTDTNDVILVRIYAKDHEVVSRFGFGGPLKEVMP